jgi:hypothetical protein
VIDSFFMLLSRASPLHRIFCPRNKYYRLTAFRGFWQIEAMNKFIRRNDATVCRWTARILGALLIFVIGFIAVGQGIPNPFTQPLQVQIGFLALALMVVGMLAGWRWELLGGIVSLVGWCMFVLGVTSPARALNSFVCALALPGSLFVISALLKGNRQKTRSA